MIHRCLVRLSVVTALATAPLPAPAYEYNDDFANGIDPRYWTVVSNQPLFTIDDSNGDVQISKPDGGPDEYQYQRVCLNHEFRGDFDARVEFSDAQIDVLGDGGANIVGIRAEMGGQLFFLSRNGEAVSDGVAGVWVDPPASWPDSWYFSPETATSGYLRITRIGDQFTGYCNDNTIHQMTTITGEVTHVCIELANNWINDPISVRFDNFSVIAENHSPTKQVAKFAGLDTDEWDEFGNPMAIGGDTLAIAAPWANDVWRSDYRGTAGTVYVFERSDDATGGWEQVASISPDEEAEILRYGMGLAIDGDYLAIGTEFACNEQSLQGTWCDAGVVHIFERNAGDPHRWDRSAEFIGEGREDWYGFPLSLSGNTLAVGAHWEGGGSGEPILGAVHLYERDPSGTWDEVAVLSASDGADDDWFGLTLELSGDTIAVGAPAAGLDCDPSVPWCDTGTVYVFERHHGGPGAWGEVARITAYDPGWDDNFGWDLALYGDTLVVAKGATFDGKGAVYFYERDQGGPDSWGLVKRIDPPARYGTKVAIRGDIVLLSGEPVVVLHRDRGGRNNWGRLASLSPRIPAWAPGDDGFGESGYTWDTHQPFAIDDQRHVIVGALVDDEFGEDAGAAYAFEIDTTPFETLALPAVARVQGAGAFFTSKWNLFNSAGDDLEVDMTYTPRADFGGDPQTVQYTIPTGVLQEITDPLEEIFGISEDAVGSVVMEVPDGSIDDLMVQSVVFARQDDGREFGQFFPARRLADALQAGETAYITTTEDPTHNRVNFGVMATRDGTSVKVSPVAPIGHVLGGSRRFNLDAAQSRQLNDIHDAFDLGEMADVQLEVEVLEGAALVYGSVVDGKGDYAGTSDPTTVQPSTTGAFEVTLLELGPVVGYDEFSGSASITNHSPNPAEVTVDFIDRSSPGVAASQNMTVAAGETLGYGDLVGDLIGVENAVGTVLLSSDNGTLLSATGREFAIFRDGEGEVTGTAGQLIEGLTGDDLLNPGKTHHFIGLRQVETGDSLERSHIAFFNPGDSRVDVTMRLFDDSGELEGEWTRGVRSLELVHVNNIVSKINPSQDGGVKRLEVTTTGPVHARAFRVNTTGDPITIEPFRR
jgi:hypothetical protein